MLPVLVGAMSFLGALALGGWTGAAALARGWQEGAASAITIQVPNPSDSDPAGRTRTDRVLAMLRGDSDIASARLLSKEEISGLLRPWLGKDSGQLDLPLPAVIAATAADPDTELAPLQTKLRAIAPGTILGQEEVWVGRLRALTQSLQACAALALFVVAGVATAVVAVATRAGLSSRRDAIEIIHGLGATDGYIAGRFAGRATMMAGLGGGFGGALSLPVLFALAQLAAPFTPGPPPGPLEALPIGLWLILPGLPLGAAVIGWTTAQVTVRRWLRRLP